MVAYTACEAAALPKPRGTKTLASCAPAAAWIAQPRAERRSLPIGQC